MAPITTKDSQTAAEPPDPYTITIGLFSTPSHYASTNHHVITNQITKKLM